MAKTEAFQSVLNEQLEKLRVALAEAHAKCVADLHCEIDALRGALKSDSCRKGSGDQVEWDANGEPPLLNVVPEMPRQVSETSDFHGCIPAEVPAERGPPSEGSWRGSPPSNGSEVQGFLKPPHLMMGRSRSNSSNSSLCSQPVQSPRSGRASMDGSGRRIPNGRASLDGSGRPVVNTSLSQRPCGSKGSGSNFSQRPGGNKRSSTNLSQRPGNKRSSTNLSQRPVNKRSSSKGVTSNLIAPASSFHSDSEHARDDIAEHSSPNNYWTRPTSNSSSSSDAEGDAEPGTGMPYNLAKIWVQVSNYADKICAKESRKSELSILDKKDRKQSIVSLGGRRSRKDQSFRGRAVGWLESAVFFEPYRAKRLAWEVFGSIMLLHDIFVLPVLIAFDPAETPFTESMVWIVRLFWTLDVAIGFVTGYVDDQGITVMSFRKIAMNYLRGSFPLDFVVVLFDWLDAIIGVRATGFLKSWRLIRVVRLLRLRKAQKLWDSVSEYVATEKVTVFFGTLKNSLILVVLLHFIACIWWGTHYFHSDSATTWNQDLQTLPLADKYFRALHFSISIFFGEHVMLPANQLERIFTILILYCSFLWQIWFVSSITTAMTHLEIVSSRRSGLFSALNNFLAAYKVPLELQLRLQRSARHNLRAQEMNTQEDSIELLNLISEPLVMRLHCEMFLPVVRVVPWLRCLCELHDQATMQICHFAMCVDEITKEDVIFLKNDKPLNPSVRLVVSGLLRYGTPESAVTVDKRHWLSEMVLWTDEWVHKGKLQAESNSRVLVIDAAQFRHFVGNGVTGVEISQYARMRLRQSDPEELTDLMEYQVELSPILSFAFPDEWEDVKGEFKECDSEGFIGDETSRQIKPMRASIM
eukprot:TRINITY_DN8754_c0_g1_i1.p1 TRINITY_DN8754_c0_g1~~TRINITY_DN8754_c0_g1_i1.p1  ORF type:complete len:876 (-),score=130.96 TRINITY_DN8754_c0_g1_i1:28-2625(-)